MRQALYVSRAAYDAGPALGHTGYPEPAFLVVVWLLQNCCFLGQNQRRIFVLHVCPHWLTPLSVLLWLLQANACAAFLIFLIRRGYSLLKGQNPSCRPLQG